MKTYLPRFGLFLLWFSWLYPFLRIAILLPIVMIEDKLSGQNVEHLANVAKYFHGGRLVSEALIWVFPFYLIVSMGLYIRWYVKKNGTMGWGRRIALGLIALYNIVNIPLLIASRINGI